MQPYRMHLRFPAITGEWMKLRKNLTGRSLNAEVLALLEQFRSSDPCSELEVSKDRGLYHVKSRHTGEVFRTFLRKDVALAFAKNALANAGFDEAGVHDATTEAA